jgi:hypothetical protein
LRDEFLNEDETLGSFGLATVGRGLDQPNTRLLCSSCGGMKSTESIAE